MGRRIVGQVQIVFNFCNVNESIDIGCKMDKT